MKKAHKIIAAAAMLFLITAILITSFQFAAYGDPDYKFYEKEYARYNVTEDLGMEMPEVMAVTKHMMAYLIGEEEELSVITDVDGERQDFFNEQDRAHMADVKNLFLGGLKVRTVCLVVFLLLLLLLAVMKADLKRLIPGAYFAGLGLFLIIVLVLGLLFASDFTKYFTIFHEIFFTNDLWLFDPATDYMIRMLPEGFFSDMTFRIGLVFVGSLAVIGLLMGIWRFAMSKRAENKNK
ncbi:TIGR01906 family membrane protein [[Clostridium] hylemonae]|uniref:TIGR01906 family membrane protein n=1 Tax=[Clostridium] hylemonae TaxID=89153 RepID=UPI001D05EB71|nr:TIGR01906 family membrane protein [[Clostridium] hylemonae]MCB7521546.1 TIGR01906 family membrane protein [[Clostridium] hylemonae]BDF05041.1 hypothetical protein CE91St63_21030 [[Clostridium] hylemonae]